MGIQANNMAEWWQRHLPMHRGGFFYFSYWFIVNERTTIHEHFRHENGMHFEYSTNASLRVNFVFFVHLEIPNFRISISVRFDKNEDKFFRLCQSFFQTNRILNRPNIFFFTSMLLTVLCVQRTERTTNVHHH